MSAASKRLSGLRPAMALLLSAAALPCHAQSQPDPAAAGAVVPGGTPPAAETSLMSEMLGTKTDVTVGFGAGVDQRYMGARDYRPLLVPMFTISRGIFLLDAVRGAGVQYQSSSGFYASDTFNYDQGRNNEGDWLRPGAGNLKNLGSVKGTFTNTVTLAQQFAPWFSVNGQAEFGLDGHQRGNQYQFGLESIAYKQNKETLTLDLTAKMGDRQYNQTYFGVTGAQSNASGYARYHPGFGIYAYAFDVTWDHRFDKHWAAELIVGGTYYPSKVASSPIVQRRYGLTALPSLSYTF